MDGITPETCAQCGFDARCWRPVYVAALFSRLGWWWTEATRSFAAEDLNCRPAAKVWSVLEYGLHSALAAAALRYDIECMLAEDGCAILDEPVVSIGDATDDNWAILDKSATLVDISREGSALAELARRPAAPWNNVGYLSEQRFQAGAVLVHVAHDASHHFMDVSKGLAAISGVSAQGVVEHINVADGGVPRWQVPGQHHGPAFQAVSMWSAEVIEELASAGSAVTPGSVGENLTLSGLPWASLRPGARLRVGETVLLELSFDANRQRAGWYGWVREGGEVHSGDKVLLEL